MKRRSPSKGDLDPDLQPDLVAKEYVAGGASCLSVLTDVEFFGGSVGDLQAARDASGLPVLRKDFTVAEVDVIDARLMGADAVLLIAAALNDEELARFQARAGTLGLAALVEVHDEEELDRALAAGARLVGVNQRDLRTFAVDHERACALAARIPADVVAVAESGIRDGEDSRRLADAGYDAIWWGRPWCERATVPPPCGPSSGTRSRPDERRDRRTPASTNPVPRPQRPGPLRQDLRHHLGSRRLLCVSLGADAVGFIFAPSTRQVSVQTGRRHRQAAPPGNPDRGHLPRRGAATGGGEGPPGRARGGPAPRARVVAGDGLGAGAAAPW